MKARLDPEREARTLRNLLYGPQEDFSWEHVKLYWIDDLPWLREMAYKMTAFANSKRK